ncbi:MAG TPA: methyltransferase domain-containing protein [Candidatus Desulfofervidus auxilii]|uniref:Methyltransferase domain-containing protein n=1 Tax=Desulfofervidus auxilii TaxID=1621989 RepID=A0A7C0U315_DESA2|nr:methyltransferase domain-containing protein [Candidatus Desulfofervidus auxilii]
MTSDLVDHLAKVHEYGKTDFRWLNLRKLVKKYVIGKSILDAGCGTGHMTLELLNDGYEVTAIDISQELVDFTKRIIKENNYRGEVHVLDLANAKVLGENKFDTIVCLDVLEHIRDDELAIKNLYYILKKNGHLIVSVPALRFLYGIRDKKIGHFRRYSKKELIKKLKNSGFQIVEIRYWNFLGVLPFLFSEKVLHSEVYEEIRYSKESFFSKFLNFLLDKWFFYIENNIRFPIGLSLIVICKK